jgi:HEAT repeat protein
LGFWIEKLSDPDWKERNHAAHVIAGIGPSAQAALPALKEAMNAQDPVFRCNAIEAFASVGRSEADMDTLVAVMTKDPDDQARSCAALVLDDYGLWAMSALIRGLADPAAGVRASAAQSLGHIGPAAKAALPALREALKDSDSFVASRAQVALARIQQSSAAP